MRRVAAFLRRLASSPRPHDLRVRDLEQERRSTLSRLEPARVLRGELDDVIRQVEAINLPPISSVAFVHGDLHDKQIFLDADSEVAIDFDGAGVGASVARRCESR